MSVDASKSAVKISLPLEFQQEIFTTLRSSDILLVIARGLGLLRVVANLLHSYDAAGDNLVLVVGATDRETTWIGDFLIEHAAVSGSKKCRGLTLVNTQMYDVPKRQKLYTDGGILSVTSQILIVDLLSGALDPNSITGIVLLHAENVKASSIEAFILRVYRQRNKNGFLKAFSDMPEAFSIGFAPLATYLRNLFLRQTALYPRFQLEVSRSLEGRRKAEVIELEVSMTERMATIQAAIMECVEASIGELKKGNTGLDTAEWNMDNAIHPNFDTLVMRQLNPVWHRLHPRTKQIAGDLRTLRLMLQYLLSYDAVKFQQYLDTILAASQSRPGVIKVHISPWLFMDAADTIFETARQRVYAGKLNDSKGTAALLDPALQPVLEELPKWEVLSEIMDEIERDNYFNPIRDDSSGAILIMCSDQSICTQLREYLQNVELEEIDDDGEKITRASAAPWMRRKLRNYIKWKSDFAKVRDNLLREGEKTETSNTSSKTTALRGNAPPNKRRRVRGSAAVATGPNRSDAMRTAGDKDAHIASLMEEAEAMQIASETKPEYIPESFGDEEEEAYFELFNINDLVVIHPYDGDMDEYILEEVRPRHVIMYEPDAPFIRRIEVYRSSHTDRNIRTYILNYKNSVDEQRYLSAVRREKDSFTKLIRERGSMTVTIDNSKLDPEEAFLRTVNTRIAGGGRLYATSTKPRVVVDIREFRSSLPSLVHANNMEIIPCMLTVGDYVISPNICVERKSISDLIASLNSGRLFNQAEMMTEHYQRPMLLIEFDQTKSFTLEPFADLTASAASGPLSSPDLQSKLVILTLAFPKLGIIWSSSPFQTAEIFAELKKNEDEPDPLKAVSIGVAELGLEDGETGRLFNTLPMDMLREIPGITEKNAYIVAAEIENLVHLANMDMEDIAKLIGRESGRSVHRFFNRNLTADG